MGIFLWIISLFWIVMGITFLLVPIKGKNFISSITKWPKMVLGLLPSIAGVLLLLAAPVSSWSWFIAILGMLGLLKGIFILVSPMGLVKATFSWWFNQLPSLYRFWGVIMIVLGILVICSITG